MEMTMTKEFCELSEDEMYEMEGGIYIPIIHDLKGSLGYLSSGVVSGIIGAAPSGNPVAILAGAVGGFVGGAVGATVSGCTSWNQVNYGNRRAV